MMVLVRGEIMLNVLLVDDEMFVRKGLAALIDWGALGYAVTGEAENGEEALAMIGELKPDLVITDIRMPVMDGLELIRNVRQQYKVSPCFIIVSGYHDFKYAQQALRYGVQDYVLKPIDEVELQDTLRKLAKGLVMEKVLRLTRDRPGPGSILDSFVRGGICGGETTADFAAALGVQENSDCVYMIAELQGISGSRASAQEEGDAVEAALASWNGTAGPLPSHSLGGGRYGILLHSGAFRLESLGLDAALNAIQSWLSRELNRPVLLAAGLTARHLNGLRESYVTAQEALQHKFAEDGQKVIRWDLVRHKPLHRFDLDQELYAGLIEQLEENNREGYGRAADAMIQQFYANRFVPSAVHHAVNRCVSSVLQVIRSMEGSEEGLKGLEDILRLPELNVDLKGLKELLLSFLTDAAGRIACLRKEQSKGGIERVKKYIETHYTENISLKSIAAAFYMNPVYLGQLFRKTYGIYFNDFLLSIRVQEAKKLLRKTDLRMYEIAERVGFQNADYFVTQFEKLAHCTPTEYRNKLIGKN